MSININLVIHNILSIISIIALCGMALFLFLNGKKKTLNRAIGTTVLMALVFVISHVVGVNISDPHLSKIVLFFNLSMFFIASTNVHAVLVLIKKEVEYKWFIIFLYISSTLFVIAFIIFPDLFLLSSTSKLYFPNYYVAGELNWIRVVFLNVIAVPYMLYKLISAYKKSNSEVDKNQYKYFSIIILVAYTIGFMPNFLVYDIMIDPIWGMSFAFIFSIPFIYAGLKYELFNIKVIAKQAFYYALSIGIVGGIIVLLNYSHTWIIELFPHYPTWITAFISAVLVVSISVIAWKNLRKADLLKYEFITTVTHKFRTPLTGIKWATENLTSLARSPEAQEQIAYVKNATEKLVELTDLLVTTSETEALSYKYNFAVNSLTEATERVIFSLSRQIQLKKLHITKSIEPNLKSTFDIIRIKFVIQSLIENAIHYTKESGSIFISTRKNNDSIVFSVHDTGIGMNKEELDLIFAKFYRTTEARAIDTEGMGIGLFIAKEIIARHKGKIWAESEGLNKGSTFSFSLPISK